MKLERVDKDAENYNNVVKERSKVFGNTSGVWICSDCKFEIDSFLKSFEIHVPEKCPSCRVGQMEEMISKRELPKQVNMIDRSREKNWEHGLSPAQQASVLLGESDPY